MKMNKGIVALISAATAVLCLLGSSAHAQGQDSCPLYKQLVARYPADCLYHWSSSGLPATNAPVTMVCCNPMGGPAPLAFHSNRFCCGSDG